MSIINQNRKKTTDEVKTEPNEKVKPNNTLKDIFLKNLSENSTKENHGQRYPSEVIDICFSIYSISPHAYNTFRNVLDLPSETTLKNHFQEIIKGEKENLTDIMNSYEIIYNYKMSNKIDMPFDVILSVDACSFDRINSEGKKYCFCFYCQPINPELSCFPLHIIPTPDGKASSVIVEVLDDLISILKDNDINVIYTCSDGDNGYNILNEQTFDIYFKAAYEGGFDGALKAWKECSGIKHINDLLHCLKIARSRLLIGCITLNCDNVDHVFNAESIEKVLLLGNTLTDDSSVGKMKDFYVFDLFNFKNLQVLFDNDLYHELLYFLPFTCWAEAATNSNLTSQMRINLLRISFDILYTFFLQNLFVPHSKGITYNNTKSSIAKVLADDNFLTRSLNSILGLAYVISEYDNVSIDCIGTHVLENFFGNIRYACKNYDSWENILSAISHGVIRKKIFKYYNININIEERVNSGGVHIYKANDQFLMDFPDFNNLINQVSFTFTNLTGIYKIMKKDDMLLSYTNIKNNFIHVINKTKENKIKLLRPGPVSSSHIISRCIGNDKRIIQQIEEERITKMEGILENANKIIDDMSQESEISEEQKLDVQNIQFILNGLTELKECIKKRSVELIEKSEINSNIIEQLKNLDESDDELVEFIEEEVLSLDKKIQSIANLELKEEIKKLEDSGVLNLIKCFEEENSEICEKYPFLYDLISILNDNSVKSQKNVDIDNFTEESMLSGKFYQAYKAIFEK